MFADFHNEKEYLQRTVEFFREKVGIELVNARRFGGFGNLRPLGRSRKGGMLYVGEAAGFQDALFGFGLRNAMLSGHLAARALLDGRPADYDALVGDRLAGLMKASVIKRYFYEKLGNRGYARLSRRIDGMSDVRDWLRRSYARPSWLGSLFDPLACRKLARAPLVADCVEGCDCTWCRCADSAHPL